MEPVDPRQRAALEALRPNTPAGWLVIYLDGTSGMAGHAAQIAQRTHGIMVRLLPDPEDLPTPANKESA